MASGPLILLFRVKDDRSRLVGMDQRKGWPIVLKRLGHSKVVLAVVNAFLSFEVRRPGERASLLIWVVALLLDGHSKRSAAGRRGVQVLLLVDLSLRPSTAVTSAPDEKDIMHGWRHLREHCWLLGACIVHFSVWIR